MNSEKIAAAVAALTMMGLAGAVILIMIHNTENEDAPANQAHFHISPPLPEPPPPQKEAPQPKQITITWSNQVFDGATLVVRCNQSEQRTMLKKAGTELKPLPRYAGFYVAVNNKDGKTLATWSVQPDSLQMVRELKFILGDEPFVPLMIVNESSHPFTLTPVGAEWALEPQFAWHQTFEVIIPHQLSATVGTSEGCSQEVEGDAEVSIDPMVFATFDTRQGSTFTLRLTPKSAPWQKEATHTFEFALKCADFRERMGGRGTEDSRVLYQKSLISSDDRGGYRLYVGIDRKSDIGHQTAIVEGIMK